MTRTACESIFRLQSRKRTAFKQALTARHSTLTSGLVGRLLPLGEMARVVAQLGCDRGLHQHVPLRVQTVPVVGGVNVLVDTAM